MKSDSIQKYWYKGQHLVPWWLKLASSLFLGAAYVRRWAYRLRLKPVYRAPVSVIVVGNITVGGSGKTPLVAWLVKELQQAGHTPGIVSRGYGGKARQWPQQVRPDSDVTAVGDEAVMLARHCQCPMAVDPDRPAAIKALVKHTPVDVIISDDGMQHYAMLRDIEIAVIDGERRFGNGLCLPAGPLREPPSRLAKVDFRVVNGGEAQANEHLMRLSVEGVINLADPDTRRELSDFAGETVHAIAGIGNPERFYSQLRSARINVIEHTFTDHHDFDAEDIVFDDEHPVLMTEKDAVKCERFADGCQWYVAVEARLQDNFRSQLLRLLETKIAARKPKWTTNSSTSSSAPSAKVP